MAKRRKGSDANADGVGLRGHRKAAFPPVVRAKAVDAVKRGADLEKVADLIGATPDTLERWIDAFDASGAAGLHDRPRGRPRMPSQSEAIRKPILEAKREHPEYGARRVRDVLRRMDGLGTSEQRVRSILDDEGLVEPAPRRVPRDKPPRRFERAQPNQLWQSDIFTFLLRRHERVYMAAFMDDHSRFVVSYAIAHHQRSTLVLEAIERGVADFGSPQEVLTDQGRQYTAWRGETEFEQWLRRQGIRHVKSRPQHPQTLGKVERFWKTLWEEFLSRTVFADYADLDRRLALFVHAYNFQRPHQALGGLVPADRFFRAAPQVRAAIEAAVADNARRLALEQPTRKPFYLVGQLGDRELSIAAQGS
jgi:transposase InsO family protein